MKPINPPGPRGLPLAGVAIAFRRDPLALLMRAVGEYGDVVELPLLKLPLTPLEPKHRLYIVNHPALVRQICMTNRAKYRTHSQLVDKLKLVLDLGEGELLTSVGEEWVQRKATLQPAFSNPGMAAEKVNRSASAMAERWSALPDDTVIDLEEELALLVTNVFASVFLSLDLEGEDRALAPQWRIMLNGFSRRMATPFRFLLSMPTRANRDFQAALGAVEQRLHSTIDAHCQCPHRFTDLLSSWLQTSGAKGSLPMSEKSIRDQIMLLLLAGRKNVSNALAWSCYLLARHPEVAERVSDEAAGAADDLKAAPYLAAVQKEVLRLYPTAWLIARFCLEDDIVGGFRIPQGATVFMSPYAIHRHPEFWPDPERFDPRRFFAGNNARATPDVYLPFGVGPRTCIGNSLTELIMRVTLAKMFARFRLELVAGHQVRIKASSSLYPQGGLPVVLRKRGKSQ
jgi:cytochrome P450